MSRRRAGHGRGVLLGALGLLLTASAARAGGVLHVDDDAPPGGDGESWATACRSLQDALARAAAGAFDEIRVAQGTYRPDEGESQTTGDRGASFEMPPAVTVWGGYAGVGAPDPDARDWTLYPTVLSGDLEENDGPGFAGNEENSYRVVVMAATSMRTLAGFRITGGHADGAAPRDRGAGIYAAAEGVSITDCEVFANAAGRGGGLHVAGGDANVRRVTFARNEAALGGAVYADTARVALTSCRLDDNEAFVGGGMHADEGILDLRGTTWDGNRAGFRGGGLSVVGGAQAIQTTTFASNFAADEGGGLYAVAASLLAADVDFHGNIAGAGGGARLIGGQPRLIGCRFEDNYAEAGAGLHTSADLVASGCAFDDNAAAVGAGAYVASGSPEFSSCTFERNVADEAGGLFGGAASPRLTACRFEANQAIRYGGGVLFDGGDAVVSFCQFVGNVVEGGFVSNGGGMHLDASSVSVTLSTFRANTAKFGGGVSIVGARARLTQCGFTDNAAIIGGGVYATTAEARLVDCVLTGNTATGGGLAFGGGVYAAGGATRVEGCLVEANAAGQDGGGLYLSEEGAVVVSSSILANTAAGTGGAIAVAGGAPLISACTLNGNAAAAGGGIANDGGAPTLINCVLSANVSTGQLDEEGACAVPGFGGGVSSVGGAPLVIGSTLSGNRAECGGNGGGAGWTSGTLANCVLWGNEDGGGADESAQVFGPSSVVNYCCVEGLTGNLGGAGNIGDDPRFADADGPDDLPGTADDDVRLAAGSPCIDAGDNDAVPEGTTTDRAGGPRFVDDPATKDTGRGPPPVVDMGAYERTAACLGDVNDDGIVDFDDLLRVLDAWGPCEGCPEDLDGSGTVDFGDLLIVLDAWGPCA